MASTLDVRIEWENNNFIRMTKRINGGNWIRVVEVEEDANISAIIPALKGLCMADFNAHLNSIMGEMRVP